MLSKNNNHAGYRVRIEAEDLVVGYDGVQALECQKLALEGNVIAVIGHNGAGKSTLIKTVLGLLPQTSGTIRVLDHATLEPLTPESHMAFCPEMGAVFADISVESYLQLWCRIKHGDGRYYRKQGSEYVELLKLEPLLKKLGRELSKGQRRRVQTAVGFLCEPRLFLFDEPFDGLDVQKTSELAQIMSDHSSRMSLVVSSHRMDVVERLADQVVVLREGRVETIGSVEEVCRDLCGEAYIISNVSDAMSLHRFLEKQLPDSLVYPLGNRVRVVGPALDELMLTQLIAAKDHNGAQARRIPLSLVDAMNFYLRKLE